MVKERTPRQNNTLPHQQVTVEVIVLIYNEEVALPKSMPVLCAYLETYFSYRWSVVIVDNASADSTLHVASNLATVYHPHVSVLHLKEKGRVRALKAAWLSSEADILAYMDVDLSYQPVVVFAAYRSFGNRPQRSLHRLTPPQERDGDAPVEARGDLTLLQPAHQGDVWQPLL